MTTLSRNDIRERLGCSYRTLLRIEPLAGVLPIETAAHGELRFAVAVVEKLRPYVRRRAGMKSSRILTVKELRAGKGGAR
jgi:hypothetical protein